MKLESRIADLSALLTLSKATTEATADRRSLAHKAETATRPEDLAPLVERVARRNAEKSAAETAWKKIPHARRTLAEESKAKAEDLARVAARLGADYSGDTRHCVAWGKGPKASARTATSKGAQYSRGCTYKKTDAAHWVTLHAPGVIALTDPANRWIVSQSDRDGLPLIALYAPASAGEPYLATWVRTKGKAIAEVHGWIAVGRGLMYHSAHSPENAAKGLARKIRERQATRKDRAAERRARLIARLCKGAVATLADARAMGLCLPGIRAFQAKHGIGDSASLPELVRTGNRDALRLALRLARQLHRTEAAA